MTTTCTTTTMERMPPVLMGHVESAPVAKTQCTCDRVFGETRWCLPLRRVADNLVSIYFSRVNRMYPVIHQASFRRQYNHLWEAENSTEPGSVECCRLCQKPNQGKLFAATLHAVFALATLFESGHPERNATQADTFFRQAQELNLLDILDDEVSMELIQVGLLMGFYLQATESFSKCWNITTLTIRMAQNMGLHLGCGSIPRIDQAAASPTQLESEMRARVWYGCVVLERYVCLSQPSGLAHSKAN
jgi:hypothetical protein